MSERKNGRPSEKHADTRTSDKLRTTRTASARYAGYDASRRFRRPSVRDNVRDNAGMKGINRNIVVVVIRWRSYTTGFVTAANNRRTTRVVKQYLDD